MYRITTGDFIKEEYGSEKYLQNWPVLYILMNQKEVYIGQSNHALTRMKEHKGTSEKGVFHRVYFIYSQEFNQSVTLDYESRMIQLIAADGQFCVRNKNAGIADKAYFNREYYNKQFRVLWEKLRKMKLVKHTIDEIANTDFFKYSPYVELNDNQREIVDGICQEIKEKGDAPIAVYGMPGSGKTIVAVFLLKMLKDDEDFRNKKIGLVVPQTSLRETLKKLFRSIYGLAASDVIGPTEVTKSRYDILLVDEAHRLHQRKNIPYQRAFDDAAKRLGLPETCDELDWILHQCKCPVLFYDKNQVVGPSGISIELIDEKLKQGFMNRMTSYTLSTQMRVKGGVDYIGYVRKLLDGSLKAKKTFEDYEFTLIRRFELFHAMLYKREQEHGLCRMIAGYAWRWVSKADSSQSDIVIDGIEKKWNNRTQGWVHSETALDEVGCIHSIQGYDLNYAFVILGNDIGYDKVQQKVIIRPENYFDQNGKKTASYPELLTYIKNIYYVLMTRGIKGTYLYVCDPDLRDYVERYVDCLG